jgi:hypothetical protein
MKPECKPGDLALILSGPLTGQTCRVLEEATPEQVKSYGFKHVTKPNAKVEITNPKDQGKLWAIDRDFPWFLLPKDGQKIRVEMPICPDTYLLPIQPDEFIAQEFVREALADGRNLPAGITRISK